MKLMVKKGGIWICALLCALCFMIPVSARTGIDMAKETSLTLSYGSSDPIPGAPFDLYRVADVSDRYILSGEFVYYQVELNGLDSNGWRAAAETLAAYAQKDVVPMDSGETDSAGRLTFENLDVGLYLVVGQRKTVGDYTYTPEPMLVMLPGTDEDNQWNYHPTAFPKYEQTSNPGEDDVTRKVLKIWKDGNGNKRPENIVVQLLQNGNVYDTVTLDEHNQWKYVWEDLDSDYVWTVAESEVPEGYTVSVSREGITFIMTNTHQDEDTPDEPKDPPLPQTGVLWWPVPLLACGGLVLFIVGWMRYRRENQDET